MWRYRSVSPRRLLQGTWRFDAKRTIAEYRPPKGASRNLARKMFGGRHPMTIKYTAKYLRWRYRMLDDRASYKVIHGRRGTPILPPKITIAYAIPFMGMNLKYRSEITFESPDVFWWPLKRGREYFRRVPPNNSLQRRAELGR